MDDPYTVWKQIRQPTLILSFVRGIQVRSLRNLKGECFVPILFGLEMEKREI